MPKANTKANTAAAKAKDNINTITTENSIEVYENEIAILCDDYINGLHDPDSIYTNNGLFVDMLKYIYKNYIKYILKNDGVLVHYNDIKLLDNLFSIYTQLVYKYKYNKKPSIIEYSLFTNVSRDIIQDWKTGNRRELTPEYVRYVKRWYAECENALLNTGGVFEIFQLKSCYGYAETAPVHVEQKQTITAGSLPVLGENSNIMLTNDIIDTE